LIASTEIFPEKTTIILVMKNLKALQFKAYQKSIIILNGFVSFRSDNKAAD
jgi:hypothetical protein